MSILPSGIDSKLQSAEEFAQRFVANALSIGLAQQEADDFASQVGNTVDARNTATLLRTQTRKRVETQNIELDTMTSQFGALVGKIKGFANASADPKTVYTLAGVPMPKTPEPRPAPATPENLTLSINNNGEITAKWDGSLYAGVFFDVERQTTSPGAAPSAWSTIASVQDKTFVDTNVPVGLAAVAYRVRARRGELVSANTVSQSMSFGAGGSSSSSSNVSMAA